MEDLKEELRRWLLEVVQYHPATTLQAEDIETYFTKATRDDLMELAIIHSLWHSPMMDPMDQDLEELEANVYYVCESWF